jgi:Glycosyl transferase family 2
MEQFAPAPERRMPGGYFESIVDDLVVGWACDAENRPAPVRVRVNGVFVESEPVRGDAIASAPCNFVRRVSLRAGDRVELFHGITQQPLAGGVRRAVDASWRPRVGIISPVKQEARYLLEWIAYHRALGVSSFVLADNGGDDGTSELLEALHELGVVQRLDWRGEREFQLRFNREAIARMHGLVDLCSITDVDEFLRPLNGRRDIPSALAEIFSRPEVSAAALSCAVYGSSGRVEAGEGLVLERFTRRAPDRHRFHSMVKSVVRPQRFRGMPNCHVVEFDHGAYVDDRGDPWDDWPISWNSLRVDHHVIKSREEFEQKARRGVAFGVDEVPPRDQAFFDVRDLNDVDDPVPAEFLARTKRELAALAARLNLPAAARS